MKPLVDPDFLPETLARHRRTESGVRARSGFELGAALGHGGMGVVRVARQRSLDRDVVIKSVRPELACDGATRMLMQEALILARLDHPNILPIHDLRFEHGELHAVLKKVDGVEWAALMHRPDRYPLAREAKQLAGTPQYMAPEMLGEGDLPITERTDVYLLGAILYEILAGRTPHVGREMDRIREQVLRSRPELPKACPSELERICRTAMAAEPSARFASAEALRCALSTRLTCAPTKLRL